MLCLLFCLRMLTHFDLILVYGCSDCKYRALLSQKRRIDMPGSLRIGKIFGIDIYIHISWVVIIVLLTWSLAVGWFPVLYHGFSAITYCILGFIAAVLLFVSVLLHELAHTLVAQPSGLTVR